MQRTIFITGTSSDLGKAAAKLFQSKGWNVIATMRHQEKETELTHLPNITLLQLDVSDVEAINDTVNTAIRKQAIDVVLNNAGYGLIGVLESLSDEQIARQRPTCFNYVAH